MSGDFMQLPPIERHGLARRLDDAGFVLEEGAEEVSGDEESQAKQAAGEVRKGHALWQSIREVASLSVNIRAPGQRRFDIICSR